MNQERLLTVLEAPYLSEKVVRAQQYNQYGFRVAINATKKEIAAAVEMFFKVKVEAVTTVRSKRESARFGKTRGFHKAWKKAYVTLAAGSTIDFTNVKV